MKAVVFDLDDTLYPEIEFVKSGFRTVARYLSSRYQFNEDSLFAEMLDILRKDGRGKVFNSLLHNLGLNVEEGVELLVYVYRSHDPAIRLFKDSLPTVQHLRQAGMRLGILTDGMASVQRRKIKKLGLESLFDTIVCSDELGEKCWKPSPIPYKIALDLLQTSPLEAAYVGDNPAKDFLAPNSLGMLTFQVERRAQPQRRLEGITEAARPKFVVKGLAELLPIIVGRHNVC